MFTSTFNWPHNSTASLYGFVNRIIALEKKLRAAERDEWVKNPITQANEVNQLKEIKTDVAQGIARILEEMTNLRELISSKGRASRKVFLSGKPMLLETDC